MKHNALFYFKAIIWMMVAALTLSACNPQAPTNLPSMEATPELSSSATLNVTQTLETEQPTLTPIPMAVIVNAESISLTEFQIELELLKAAKGSDLTEEDNSQVIDNLIEQSLLAQAAQENGFSLDESSLENRIQQLANQMGGKDTLETWVQAQGYSQELFRQALTRSLEAAWMRDLITSNLPTNAEQVLARQILVTTQEEANQIFEQLEAGNDFGNLALQYSPLTGGSLLWFPRGYLPDSKLEDIIFSLQPGEYSPVTETIAGFHIVQVLERQLDRPLDADALQVLKTKAIQDWLEQHREEGQIEVLIP